MRWLTRILSKIRRFGRRLPEPLGKRGERLAARHLTRLGYRIVSRSDRGKLGEIDLVAVDGDTVVFVEVKTRSSWDAGHPSEAVDAEKQRRLTRLALSFLKRHRLLNGRARFDVVAITCSNSGEPPQIQHFPNAFPAVGYGQMFC